MGSYWGKTRIPVISHADRASYAFSRRMARPVVLSSDQQEILEARARARSAPARSVERARIVLLAAAGLQDQQIAATLKITPEKAARWRNRLQYA